MRYRVHRVDVKMTSAQTMLAQFLNSLDGEVIAIIPNVTTVIWFTYVNFVLVVEKLDSTREGTSAPSGS